MNYISKIQKYKRKLRAINLQYGGTKDNIVIHICGPSGSDKTTLGKKLKEKFGDKIVVVDIDDLRHDFVVQEYGEDVDFNFDKEDDWHEDTYQNYIDGFVKKQEKPLVFVGLNNMPWWNNDLYYDIHANYKFYIDLDKDIIYRQKCDRFFSNVFEDREHIINDFIKNYEDTYKKFTNGVSNECGYEKNRKLVDKWNKDYKDQHYEFMNRDEIFEKVSEILQKLDL